MAAESDKREEGFLQRWSRRKREQDRPADPVPSAPSADPPSGNAEPTPEAADEQDIVASLPDIETLARGSDFKPFLQAGVPAALKRQALRKLWASNPLYNRIDMLDDYCEDYSDRAKVVEGLKTAYRVGRGMIEKLDQIADSQDKMSPEHGEPQEQAEVTDGGVPDATKPVAEDKNHS